MPACSTGGYLFGFWLGWLAVYDIGGTTLEAGYVGSFCIAFQEQVSAAALASF
jgi:hypothetical protein